MTKRMVIVAVVILIVITTPAVRGDATPGGAIEATIAGTAQPLEVDLLLRTENNDWQDAGHKVLPAGARSVRFDGLPSGIYQVLVKGPQPTERLGAKLGLGTNDTRRITIHVEPFEVAGNVSLGGVSLGEAVILLRHKELHWRAGITLDGEGRFRVPMWQRGEFTYGLRGPSMPASYHDEVTLDGPSPIRVALDLPDGRIAGTVRDAKSGAPLVQATVAVQMRAGGRQQYVRLETDAEGRFDLFGVKYGRHTVRIAAPLHVEPEPIAFELDASARSRELDVRLDPGRTVDVVVIDPEQDPVAGATVFAIAGTRLASRATTDEDGRTSLAAPAGEEATLFVVAREAAFGVLRVTREPVRDRLRVYLPRAASSLLIRARTTEGNEMPPFSVLMRYNGALVPAEIADELADVQGLRLATGPRSELLLRNIPSGNYEFWPYRTAEEAEAIVASADGLAAPIRVDVKSGENKVAVKFAAR